MQASPINAAQLMMEFLEKEQADIGQGIVSSEFSRELEHQQFKLEESSTGKARPSSSKKPSSPLLQASSTITADPKEKKSGVNAVSSNKTEAIKRLAADRKPVKDSSSQIQDQMFLSNPALLEKVLADLKLPAEARKVCKGSEDNQGRVSLGDLMSVLDQNSANQSTLTQGRAMGKDLQALFASSVHTDPADSLNLNALIGKPRGAYTVEEFRQILGKAVRQVQVKRTDRSLSAVGNAGSEKPSRPSGTSVASGFTTRNSPDQSAHLVKSSIPSFLKENGRNGEKGAVGGTDPSNMPLSENNGTASSQDSQAGAVRKPGEADDASPPLAMERTDILKGEWTLGTHGGSQVSIASQVTPGEGNLGNGGDPGHTPHVSMRALGDMVRGIAGEAALISIEKSDPADAVQHPDTVLPIPSGGILEGKVSTVGFEAAHAVGSLKDILGIIPVIDRSEGGTTAVAPTLPPVSGKAAHSSDSSAGDSMPESSRESSSLPSMIKRARIDAIPERPQDAETRAKAELGMLAGESGKTLRVEELRLPVAPDTAMEKGQIGVSGKWAASSARSEELPSSSASPEKTTETPTPSATGQTLDSETGDMSTEAIETPYQQQEDGLFRESTTRKIQVAGILSRLDGIPVEKSRNPFNGNPQDPGESEMVASGALEFSESFIHDPWASRLSSAEKAAFQSIHGTAGTASQSLESSTEGFHSQSSHSGDPGTGHYSPGYLQHVTPTSDIVKTGTGEPLSFLSSSWPQHMVQLIQNLAKEKRGGQLTLELEPRELGRLTLRVATKSDEVTAHVSADKEQAREILLRNASVLRQQLEEQGLSLGRFNVDVQEGRKEGRHFGESGSPSNDSGRSNRLPREDTVTKDLGIQLIRESEKRLISVFA